MKALFRPTILLLAAAVLAAASAMPDRYQVVDGSQFRIEGTSTLGRYTCIGEQVDGQALVTEPDSRVAAELTVPVDGFDCQRSRMTRDFREALKNTVHPSIQIYVGHATVTAPRTEGAWVPVEATARIRLAGVERTVTLSAEGRSQGAGHVQIRGEHAFRMTDFGVRPPSGLGGLVRAHDRVVARFDLMAEPK
ncbi:MAG: hypothetical protein Rubg2KO_13180 [Rubricoccaceae bacterium]